MAWYDQCKNVKNYLIIFWKLLGQQYEFKYQKTLSDDQKVNILALFTGM